MTRAFDLPTALEIITPFVSTDIARKPRFGAPIGQEWNSEGWVAGTDGRALCAVRCDEWRQAKRETQAPIDSLMHAVVKDGYQEASGQIDGGQIETMRLALSLLTARADLELRYDREFQAGRLTAKLPRKTGRYKTLRHEVRLCSRAPVDWAPAIHSRTERFAVCPRYLLRGLQAIPGVVWLLKPEKRYQEEMLDPLMILPAGQTPENFNAIVLVGPRRT